MYYLRPSVSEQNDDPSAIDLQNRAQVSFLLHTQILWECIDGYLDPEPLLGFLC